MKNLLFTMLVTLMTAFSIQACEIYVEFDPAWSCGELEVCWGVPNGNGNDPNNGNNCITITEGDLIDIPNGVDITFSTENCNTDTYFNIFNGEDELLTTVAITGPNIEWTWTIDCAALPVELVSFNGRTINNVVKLNWLLASQENLEKTIIYRKDTVVGVLENVDKEQMAWSFTDKTAQPGINYYSLEFRDYDGKRTYSDVIAVELNKKGVTHITKQVTNTHRFRAVGKQFLYRVFVSTLEGSTIQKQTWRGEEFGELDILFTHPGMYIVTMVSNDHKETFKVIVE